MSTWTPIGNAHDLQTELTHNLNGLKELDFDGKKIVLSFYEGQFGALNNKCNHMGAPLAKGKLKKGCVECPWHYWHFQHQTGEGVLTEMNRNYVANPGTVPTFPLKIENGTLFINLEGESERQKAEFKSSSNLAREVKREPGPLRVLGLSTTVMDPEYPRYSTSEDLLISALDRARAELGVETRTLKLAELNFRHCEGFYSKSERACTWPCSITKIDPNDQMIQVYENLVHWSDIVIVSTPIRWGNASSLYYKMAERLNSVQNRLLVEDKRLIKNKTAGFIITGGQDNIQSVAGEMLNFFGELGFVMPAFPYVAHSLGWSAEKMEANMDFVRSNQALHDGAFALVKRNVELAGQLVGSASGVSSVKTN